MKVLITGAHFTPAVAVIEQLRKIPNVEIVYVGRKTTLEGDKTQSIESEVLPKMGVKFIPLITGRLQRSFTVYTIPSLLKIPFGFIQAGYIFFTQKPDVILSFGGYIAIPIVIVSWLFSIPIIIHEQTLVFGLSSKLSSLFADKIAFSFEQGIKLTKPFIITGNPIRQNILTFQRDYLNSDYEKIFKESRKEKLPIILITCGNQGSHIINKTIEEVLDKLTKIACIIHISGDNKFNDFERLEKLQNDRYIVKRWIDKEYGEVLSKVDLVISRAGINTLMELAYVGKPTLVIPLPYIYLDEQNKNAKYFEKLGLVRILSQSNLKGETLLEESKNMLSNLDQLKNKAGEAKKIIIPDAAKRLALETILLSQNV